MHYRKAAKLVQIRKRDNHVIWRRHSRYVRKMRDQSPDTIPY